MLITLFLSIMTLSGFQQADSVSNEWLLDEWNNSYEKELVNFEMEDQIIIVSSQGGVLHQFAKSSLSDKCASCIAAYQKADFLFELNSDTYYLLQVAIPIVQPSETVPYSSAE